MTKRTQWPVVEVTVETDAAEAAVFALTESGADGTSYSLQAKPGAPCVKVRGFFDHEPDVSAIETKVNEALAIYGFPPSSLEGLESVLVEDQDWLAEWKKHWKPTITDRFIVAAPWQEIEAGGRLVIRIEPKMAFGTGTHETTRLCLRAIEELCEPGCSLLDVGTGTGILAIAAAKLAGETVVKIEACDIDPEAVAAAVENTKLNECSTIAVYEGSIDESTSEFDIICANLTTDVILPVLPLLAEKSRKALILSGILTEKAYKVTNDLERLGYTEHFVETDGEWVSVTVRKRD